MTTKDSNGKQINPGDIIECVNAVEGDRYHVCLADIWGIPNNPEIRDLAHNNLDVWQQYDVINNLGHFTVSRKRLSNIQLREYFGLDIPTLKDNGVTSLIVNGVEMIENEP